MKRVPVWVWVVLGVLALGAGGGVALVSGTDALIQKIAEGIATAEGYFVAGSRPNRNNNPGDLTLDLGFPSIGKDGMFVIFATAEDGWNALRRQVSLMLSNQSQIYNSAMSIFDVASRYTTTDVAAWASTVAQYVGVDVSTPLNQIVLPSSGQNA
jgi:hypothetical protein